MYACKFIRYQDFKSDRDRSRENLRDQTGALNQRGLEYALEELARQRKKSCYFIKVSMANLGKCNDKYGHKITDQILYDIRKMLAAQRTDDIKFNIYRTGADWVILFEKKPALKVLDNIQKNIRGYKYSNNVRINLATVAVAVELKINTLHTIYSLIDHLKPAKGQAFQKHIIDAYCYAENSVRMLNNENIFEVNNLLVSRRSVRVDKNYLQKYRKMERLINKGSSYEQIEKKIMDDINGVLPKECLEIKNIHFLDYNDNYRVIGKRTVFIDERTIIMPLLNVYNKPVGGLRIELRERNNRKAENELENNLEKLKSTLDGKPIYRFDHWRTRAKDQHLNKLIRNLKYYFNSDIFVNTYNLLVDLRQYSPVLSLLDQTGRSSFASRAIEPYLQDILDKKKKRENLPEYKFIQRLLDKDGFVVIKRGGEEFFIYFAPLRNSKSIGLSFDYNKFSRHSTSWGEAAGDRYMEQTSGLLRYYLAGKVEEYRKNKIEFTRVVLKRIFLEALNAVNEREIEYPIRDPELKIVNKEGKQVFFSINKSGRVVLFAAADQEELDAVVSGSRQKLKSKLVYSEENMLTRRKLLYLNGENFIEGKKYDLNGLKSVNPKAIYHLEEGKVSGKEDQQFLRGLSLAGGIVDIGKILEDAINNADQTAEDRKKKINAEKTSKERQPSDIGEG